MHLPEKNLESFKANCSLSACRVWIVLLTMGLTGCTAVLDDSNTMGGEAELAARDPWHRAKLNGVAFRAIGQEPGWLMEISTGEKIVLSMNYGQDHYLYPYPEPEVFQSESRTVFELVPVNNQPGGHVELRGEPCIDTMSGEAFQVMVIISHDSLLYQGCGRALY